MGVSLGKGSATTSKCSNKSCKIECMKETAEIFGTTGAEFLHKPFEKDILEDSVPACTTLLMSHVYFGIQ